MKIKNPSLILLSSLTGLLLTVPPTLAATNHIQPQTWHYIALKELVELSGCTIKSDIFQENRALKRSEFANILKTCQAKISQTFSTGLENDVAQNHRARLQRLLKDFDADDIANLEQDKYKQEDIVNSQITQLQTPVDTTRKINDLGGEFKLPIRNENSTFQLKPLPTSPKLNTEISSKTVDPSMSQVTNVSQLRDVSPEDWAFTALSELVERYGCIAGYPNGNFLGNRTLSRYEFAAGLNACLQKINQLIAAKKTDFFPQEDFAKLELLTKNFQSELTAIQSRVDNLESQIAELESRQFSTTTKFGGEVIFSLAAAEGGDPPGTGEGNLAFNYLARIGLATSFTGRDRLSLILSSGNFDNAAFAGANSLNSYSALLSFQDDRDDSVVLDSLEYRFASFNNRVVWTFKPVGFNLSTVLTVNSPYLSSGTGSISRFAEASPLFKIGALDAGIGFDWYVGKPLRLQMAYGTRNSNDPTDGIFRAKNSAFGVQLLFTPSNTIATGLHYINSYSEDGRLNTFTGSFNADTSGLLLEPTQTHAVGGSFQWRFTEKLILGGWGGYTFTNAVNSDKWANTSTYLVSLGVLDPFGQEGNLLAVLIGQPPKLEDGDGLFFGPDNTTSLHYEVFYRHRFNDNFYMTPGFFIVTDPGHRYQNNNIFVGVLRSTFRF
ncbi:MAG: iron uptake porin [Sphaerospermopsis sp. SIO1G2]|nr:iron uptake porin [Sphaerospermopsis sp. SIO1G2]